MNKKKVLLLGVLVMLVSHLWGQNFILSSDNFKTATQEAKSLYATTNAPLTAVVTNIFSFNTFYTNTNQRSWITCGVQLNATATRSGGCKFLAITGGTTNKLSEASFGGIAVMTTNSISCILDPNQVYIITNVSVAPATAVTLFRDVSRL